MFVLIAPPLRTINSGIKQQKIYSLKGHDKTRTCRYTGGGQTGGQGLMLAWEVLAHQVHGGVVHEVSSGSE